MTGICHTFNTSHTPFRCRESMSKNKLFRTLGAGSGQGHKSRGVTELVVLGRERQRKGIRGRGETKVTSSRQSVASHQSPANSQSFALIVMTDPRSEERRVGKECRSR